MSGLAKSGEGEAIDLAHGACGGLVQEGTTWSSDNNLLNSTLLRAVWGTYTSTPTVVT